MLKYSVLMSTYAKDDAAFLKAAVSSMLLQSVAPDEFVLVCDGPLSEDLDNVIAEFKGNPVFKIVRLGKNSGLGIALNEGLKYCTNELVARMDSDDLASPYRCELQLKAFEEDPELTFTGGAVEEFTGAAVNVSD
ncbi:MAG: glycosyltransferase, partial [Parasporobacterium sp.]|nr:glycosyltransferase [Parasporobacterium sp.]